MFTPDLIKKRIKHNCKGPLPYAHDDGSFLFFFSSFLVSSAWFTVISRILFPNQWNRKKTSLVADISSSRCRYEYCTILNRKLWRYPPTADLFSSKTHKNTQYIFSNKHKILVVFKLFRNQKTNAQCTLRLYITPPLICFALLSFSDPYLVTMNPIGSHAKRSRKLENIQFRSCKWFFQFIGPLCF